MLNGDVVRPEGARQLEESPFEIYTMAGTLELMSLTLPCARAAGRNTRRGAFIRSS